MIFHNIPYPLTKITFKFEINFSAEYTCWELQGYRITETYVGNEVLRKKTIDGVRLIFTNWEELCDWLKKEGKF